MERFRIVFEVDAETPEQALEIVSAKIKPERRAESLGYVHPDGVVRECGLPPAGFFFRSVTSEYYGSHDELGEGDLILWVAVPKGKRIPKIRLSHGHTSSHWECLEKLPEGSLVWQWTGWVPVSRFLAGNSR